MPFDTTTQTRPEALPVSHDAPAGFSCGGRFNRDGTERADYGKVFWTPTAHGATAYYFDRKGNDFACWIMGGDREGQLVVHGRSFEIAGHVAGLFQ
jgi:hypothetical protein